MTIEIDWVPRNDNYSIRDATGMQPTLTANTRDQAITKARNLSEPGQAIVIMGPRQDSYEVVRSGDNGFTGRTDPLVDDLF